MSIYLGNNKVDLFGGQPIQGTTPTGNIQITRQSGTDVSNYATASVRSGSITLNNLTVNSSGLVTASATVGTSGWVGSAPANKTLQLTTQAAKTVTPSSSSQTAVSSGRYTTGNITVAAVPTETGNAVANGTYTPSSGKFFSSFNVNTQTYFGENLHNPATDTPNTYIDVTNGQVVSYTGWTSSDFIEVDNTSFYSLNRQLQYAAFYDSNKNYIGFMPDNFCLIQFSDSRIKYCRVSYSAADMEAFTMQKIISGEIIPVYNGSIS